MSVNDTEATTDRFSDVAGELFLMLTPFVGYSKKPLVPLEKAIEPLISIIPRISIYAYVVKQRSQNPANNLTIDESAAIALYTMEWEPYTESVYYILNQTLRSEDRQNLKPWFLYLKLLLTALSRLPSIRRTVYRGVRFESESDNEKYQVGTEFIWWDFSSCTTNRSICANEIMIGQTCRRTLFIIDCIRGKDIGKHSYYRTEGEVLLLPATKLKVVNNGYQQDDLHVIHMKEIELPFMFLESASSDEEITTFKMTSISNQESPIVKPKRSFKIKINNFLARFKSRSKEFQTKQRPSRLK
jgi:hypothetical protein